MAIRLREVNSHLIAICAAVSDPKEGDVYLDDNVHYALTVKFMKDLSRLFSDDDYDTSKEPLYELMNAEEIYGHGG